MPHVVDVVVSIELQKKRFGEVRVALKYEVAKLLRAKYEAKMLKAHLDECLKTFSFNSHDPGIAAYELYLTLERMDQPVSWVEVDSQRAYKIGET